MQVKCEYCGNLIGDRAAVCPHCGAPNANVKRTADGTPKTIAELAQWYRDRNLPPAETTRFFIGEDYSGPRAFGIYEQGGEYIVYKNKADGSRSIRYRGTDQAYAVNELYLKLKSEILNQKARQGSRRTGGKAGGAAKKAGNKIGSCLSGVMSGCLTVYGLGFLVAGLLTAAIRRSGRYLLRNVLVLVGVWCAIFFLRKIFNRQLIKENKKPTGFFRTGIACYVVCLAATFVLLLVASPGPRPRYFRYNDTTYSSYDGDYYIYVDDLYDYEPVPYEELPADFTEHTADYEFDATSIQWVDNYEFTDSGYYEEHLAPEYDSGDYDNDSDWDWDSGDSWDSGGGDWDSDW